ncbi:MAG: hypothetical protein HRT52_01325 [Colwellia sp.]|nr:hypothetical protein [Colwellia sp.]
MPKNTIIIHNPIYYDLGYKFEESLSTIERISDLLKQTFPSWNELEQNYAFIAYNFSYLSLHIPRVLYNVAEKKLFILGTEVTVILNVSIRINGTIFFEYQYVFKHSQCTDVTSIVNVLQGYVNVSYKGYLQQIDAFKNSISKLKFPEIIAVDSIFDDGVNGIFVRIKK